MKTMKFKILGLALLLALGFSREASAATIIKFDLGGTGPDVAFTSGSLSTVNDGDASTLGDQNTSVDFVNGLSFLPDIVNGMASLTLSDVLASGPATVVNGVVSVSTSGGSFQLYSTDNSLLLSGTLDAGVISGTSSLSTGSFFNTTAGTFTGGSLLAFVAPTPAGISLALGEITSGSTTGLMVDNLGNVANFTANGTGAIDGSPNSAVPEPASLVLMLTGTLLGGVFVRRRPI